MAALVRELGPARFQRLWQSPKSIEDAYFDATGEPIAAWLNRGLVRSRGPYRIGPLPDATALLLALIIVAACAASAMRWAKRPHAT